MPLVDALRALAATLIVWHHFALYWPHPDSNALESGNWTDWLWNLRWAVQVFFVISGYLMALSLAPDTSIRQPLRLIVVRRYFRLALPYMAAIALAIAACAWGRDWLGEEVVGAPPKLGQILAHLFFVQDILGYESLAAGVWFLGIDFQMALVFVVIVALSRSVSRRLALARREPTFDPAMLLGFALAAASIWYFNLDERWDVWAVYFFGHFFTGVMVYYALANRRYQPWFALYAAMLAAGLAYAWRGHLAISLLTGLGLFFAGKYGILERWPASRVIGYQGRTSYSLFLLHFPVLVVVAALWARFDWEGRDSAIAALAVAYVASVLLAAGFYHAVEMPAARLARRFG